MRLRSIAIVLSLLLCGSSFAETSPPPVFSVGVNAEEAEGSGFGVLVKWRGICTAVMPNHVAVAAQVHSLGGKPAALVVRFEGGSQAVLSSNAHVLEVHDLYVSILGSRDPVECSRAPDLNALLQAIDAASTSPRDSNSRLNFFINSFGKSTNLVAKYRDELERVLIKEDLEYYLGVCLNSVYGN